MSLKVKEVMTLHLKGLKMNNYYCSECNFAITETQYLNLIPDYCVNCNLGKIYNFYQIGSNKHKQILSGEYYQPLNNIKKKIPTLIKEDNYENNI